jgi:Xaa-Pro aminopeptidase
MTENLNTKKISFFKKRLSKLRKKLETRDLYACIISKTENIYYLSGFFAKDSDSLLLIFSRRIYLLVHFIYFEHAKKTCCLNEIEIVQYTTDRNQKLSSLLSGAKCNLIGLEGNDLSFNKYKDFSKIIKKQGKKTRNISGIIEDLRVVKDELELSLIKKSCEINDEAISSIIKANLDVLKSITERSLAMLIEQRMVELGSTGKSFDLIVANNRSASLPHYEPSNIKIKEGMLLMDLGCVYKNYCSDMTRTIFLGKSKYTGKFKEIYDIVLQAQIMALDYCRAGIEARELDRVSRNFIAKRGYGNNFGHGLGHGVGLEVHEAPRVSYTEKDILEEDMVITIEPGIYIENIGGIRIEDMVIVKKHGCVNLYNSPKVLSIIN